MDGMLDLLNSFISSFSPSYIYDGAYFVATRYMAAVSGTLLVVAVFIRMMNASIDSLDGAGRYAGVIKSLLIWGSVLGMYFTLADLVTDFFNVLYDWSRQNGSVGQTMKQLGFLLEDLDRMRQERGQDMGMFESITDFINNIPRGMAFLVFFLTFVLVVFVELFLQLAQAIGYAVALIFGTIAIPLAVSQKLSVLSGWAKFTAAILVWPVIEALLMFLLLGLSGQMGADIQNFSATNAGAAGIYLLFAIMNLIMAASIIAAPFIAMTLVNNSGSITGLVSPFIGGAIAATMGTGKVLAQHGGGSLVQKGGEALQNLNTKGGDLATRALGNAARAPLKAAANALGGGGGSSGPASAPPAGGGLSYAAQNPKFDFGISSPAAATAAYTFSAGGGAAPVDAGAAAGAAAPGGGGESPQETPRKRALTPEQQARRGAIINNLKKAKA